jgi:D-arabinose 1-dehydrogenase-like Zn-dependent alcohol dehydrogenase
VELCEGVTTRKVGDRIGNPWLQSTCGRCEWCQRGKSFFCPNHIATGINIAGGHAEYMVAYDDGLCRNHHRYYKISQSMHIVGYASE